MTRSLAMDENGDIYLGADGNLAIVTGLEATMQAAQQAAQTMLGEMQYAVDKGMPNFDVIWSGSPNISQFDAYLRRTLLSVEHVIGIKDLIITRNGNTLSYVATIQTDYGTGALNG